MNVKAVVKVMNFHALLRVDASRRQAERYNAMEEELEVMMRIIQSNRNLRLDRRLQLPDPSLPKLQIYLGSDFGFCGGVNASVSGVLAKDGGNEKIVVGKKIRRSADVSLSLDQEDLELRMGEVRAYLERAVKERPWSGVELIYNHFYNLSSIKQVSRQIYPLAIKEEDAQYQWDDFMLEGNPETLLQDITVAYLTYEVRIAVASAYASENITRQNATTESLKKLDEVEAEELRRDRKEKNQKTFQKTIDSFVKQKSLSQVEN